MIRMVGNYNKVYMLILFSVFLFAVFIFGCGSSRDLSSPEKAIIGHWEAADGSTEYYFNENIYFMTDHEREDPNVFEVSYIVLATDAESNWLRIGVIEEENSGALSKGDISVYREICISEDGASFYMGLSLDGPEIGEAYEESILLTQRKWLYVDSETEPSGID